MKFRIVVDESAEDEVVLKCREINEQTRLLQDVISSAIEENSVIVLHIGATEYFVEKGDILFFETDNGRTSAHTADKMYYTEYKLYELEKLLPPNFIRISKSCILNSAKVSAITKNLAGSSTVEFRGSSKKVYVSRGYYKMFKARLDEMRPLA